LAWWPTSRSASSRLWFVLLPATGSRKPFFWIVIILPLGAAVVNLGVWCGQAIYWLRYDPDGTGDRCYSSDNAVYQLALVNAGFYLVFTGAFLAVLLSLLFGEASCRDKCCMRRTSKPKPTPIVTFTHLVVDTVPTIVSSDSRATPQGTQVVIGSSSRPIKFS